MAVTKRTAATSHLQRPPRHEGTAHGTPIRRSAVTGLGDVTPRGVAEHAPSRPCARRLLRHGAAVPSCLAGRGVPSDLRPSLPHPGFSAPHREDGDRAPRRVDKELGKGGQERVVSAGAARGRAAGRRRASGLWEGEGRGAGRWERAAGRGAAARRWGTKPCEGGGRAGPAARRRARWAVLPVPGRIRPAPSAPSLSGPRRSFGRLVMFPSHPAPRCPSP